jgi:cytochrome c oxidase subunit IV
MAATPDSPALNHPGDKTDVVVHGGHDPDVDRTKQYVLVAFVLAVLTALEVATYLLPQETQHTPMFAVVLVFMMTVKFVTVTLFFMHLKFDKRFLTVVFYSALVLAFAVYIAVLTTFRFWTPADHVVTH